MKKSSSCSSIDNNPKSSIAVNLPSVSKPTSKGTSVSQEKCRLQSSRQCITTLKNTSSRRESFTKQYFVDEEIDKLYQPKKNILSTAHSNKTPCFSIPSLSRRMGLGQGDYMAINKIRNKFDSVGYSSRGIPKLSKPAKSRRLSMRDIKTINPNNKGKSK